MAASNAHAQTWNWIGPDWTSPSSWDLNSVPLSSDTTILSFIQPLAAGTVAQAPVNPGTFQLNGLLLSSRSAASWGLNSINTIFQFRGTNAFVDLEGDNTSFLHASVQIGANLTIGGSGSGTFNLTGSLQNAAGFTPATINVSLDPRAILDLNTNSVFAGTWVLNSGTLKVEHATGLGNVQTNLVFNGGRILFAQAGNASFTAPITLNQTLSLGGVAKFTGAISGTGGFFSDRSFTALNGFQSPVPTLEFAATSPFSGPIGVGASNKVTLSGAQGAFTGATSYALDFESSLTIDNTVAPVGLPNGRVRDDAAILLNRADLILKSGSTTVSERVGQITLRGMGQLNISAGSGSQLLAGSLVRENRSTVHFIGSNIGAPTGSIFRFDTSLASGLVGGGGATGSTHQSILPYAFARNGSTESLVTLDPTGAIRALTPSEYTPNIYGLGSAPTQENVQLVDACVWIDRSTTVNALAFGTGLDPVPTSGIFGSAPLRIGSGAIVTGSPSILNLFASPSLIGTSELDFGAREGVVHVGRNLTILSPVSGAGGLTKSGAAALVLDNSASTLSGQISIHAGTLAVSTDSALGNPLNPVLLASGGNGGLSFQSDPAFGAIFPQSFASARAVTLFGSGGRIGAASAGTVLDFSGPVSGSGNLFIQGSGVTRLLGANTFAGDTIVAGQLTIGSSGALGTSGGLTLLTDSTLRALGSFTLDRPVHLSVDRGTNTSPTGIASIVVGQGDVLTAAAPIGDYGVLPAVLTPYGLQKVGEGTLVATANNRFRGDVIVGTPRPRFADTVSPNAYGGALVLSGSDGAFSAANSLGVYTNSALVLDNTTANRDGRIGGGVRLEGGNLIVRGNPSTSTTERTSIALAGSGTGDPNRFSTITMAPGSGQSILLSIASMSLGNSMTGGLLLRGDGLGAGVGLPNSSNMLLDTLPNGTSGGVTLPGVIADTSSTGLGTTFARLDPVRGIVPLAAADFVSSLTAGANIDLHSSASIGQDLNATSLRLGSGASFSTQGHQLYLSSGMVLVNGDPQGTDITGGGTLYLDASSVIHTLTPLRLNNTRLSSSGQIVKSGPSDLTLSLANADIAGPVVTAGGTLHLSEGISAAAPRHFILQPSVFGAPRLDLAGAPIANSFIYGDGILDLGNGGSVTGLLDFRGSVVGNGRTVGGPALDLTSNSWLSGASTFTGQTWVHGGSLMIESDQPATGPGPVGSGGEPVLIGNLSSPASVANLVLAPGVRFFDRDIEVLPGIAGNPTWIDGGSATLHGRITLDSITRLNGTFAGEITGPGTVRQDVGFPLQLMHANTYSGGTDLRNNGVIGIGNDSALGAGPVNVLASASLRSVGGARTISNPVNFAGALATTLTVTGVDDLRLAGNVNLGSVSPTIQIHNTATTTLAGTISGPTSVGFTKSGPGVLVLTGANTFTGTTNVAAGVLLSNNTAGSGLGTGPVSVGAGALLGGNGTIAGSLTLASGAILAPGRVAGFGPGTLTIGGLSSAAGSLFTFDLGGPLDPVLSDHLIIANATALSSITGSLDIRPYGGFGWGQYVLVQYNGPLIAAAGRQLTLPASIGGYSTELDYISHPGQVLLNVVPSPGPAFLIGVAASVLGVRRRRI